MPEYFSVTLQGNTEAHLAIDKFNARVSNLAPVMRSAAIYELAQAQGRIEAGGPGWRPTIESGRGSSLNRGGFLLRSLSPGAAGNVWKETPNGLEVGTSYKTDDGWNIGRMMQYGTGIYGRGTPIVPLHGPFLVFRLNGRVIRARSVLGSPPREFLYFSDADRQHILEMLEKYVREQQ